MLSRLGTPLVAGLAGAVIFLVLFGLLADEMREGDTRQFDDAVRLFVHAHSSTGLTSVMRFLSVVGSPLVVTLDRDRSLHRCYGSSAILAARS